MVGRFLRILHGRPHETVSATFFRLTVCLLLYFIAANGVVSGNDPTQDMQQRLAVAAGGIRENPRWLHSEHSALKNDFYLAKQQFQEDERQQLQEQYRDVLPIDTERREPYIANVFNFTFQGIGDWVFFTTKLDFNSNTVTFETFAGYPHYYFVNTTYAYIRYLDPNGVEIYRRNFIGDQNNIAVRITFPLSPEGQGWLLIHHKEYSVRLHLYNEAQNYELPVYRNNVFDFVYDNIRLVVSSNNEDGDSMVIPPGATSIQLMRN